MHTPSGAAEGERKDVGCESAGRVLGGRRVRVEWSKVCPKTQVENSKHVDGQGRNYRVLWGLDMVAGQNIRLARNGLFSELLSDDRFVRARVRVVLSDSAASP